MGVREISETWGVHTRERCASGVFILEAGVFQEHIHIRDVCLCVCVCVCVCVCPQSAYSHVHCGRVFGGRDGRERLIAV